MEVMTSADSPACGNFAWLLLASNILCCAVTRFQCHSDLYEMDLMMDINTSIYPLHVSRLPPITSFASVTGIPSSYATPFTCAMMA